MQIVYDSATAQIKEILAHTAITGASSPALDQHGPGYAQLPLVHAVGLVEARVC
jgi:hypothetical protein